MHYILTFSISQESMALQIVEELIACRPSVMWFEFGDGACKIRVKAIG